MKQFIKTNIINKIRFILFRRKWKKINSHNKTTVSQIFPVEYCTVGKHTYGKIDMLNSKPYQYLKIGNYCSIATGVKFLVSSDHFTDILSTYPFSTLMKFGNFCDVNNKGPIIVEDEVWIGMNAIIGSGVKLGKGSIVAAGSVVVKDVPPYAIVGGTPAKIIKYRFSEEIIEVLKDFSLNDIPDAVIKAKMELFYQKIKTVKDAKNIVTSLAQE
ncbi:MAG: CatB-related O-acetyltransferase [Bacteroidales bacterium]|jgi:acetyltransferase-like isoleucine patch superfamily enzyme|nr:CatB-related O-acetyltransferase [Bacteroidales bacterium]